MAVAWEEWKTENPEHARRGRSPWFELVDRELLDINSLIQSKNDREYRLGLQKLRSRISASEQARSNIKSIRTGKATSKQERIILVGLVRRGPPFLREVLEDLESDQRRDEGKQKLSILCQNVAAPQTTIRPPPSYQTRVPAPEAQSQDRNSSTNNARNETQVALDLLRNLNPPSQIVAVSAPPSNMTGRLDTNAQERQSSSLRVNPQAKSIQRPPTGVIVRDFAVEAANGHSTPAPRRQSRQFVAAPAAASPQTALYMNGGGTKAPTYISPSKFFAEHGEEHGVERPPAYATVAPSVPAAAQFMPKDKMDEDAYEMQMEGRREQFGPRQTRIPSSIPEASNGVGGRSLDEGGLRGRVRGNRNRQR